MVLGQIDEIDINKESEPVVEPGDEIVEEEIEEDEFEDEDEEEIEKDFEAFANSGTIEDSFVEGSEE